MTSASFPKAFARVIRKTREAQGVSQMKLAAKAKVSRQFVGTVERGEQQPTIEKAHELARALGVKLWTLVREAEGE